MSTLSERLTRGVGVQPDRTEHARRLVADWQLLADLAFADLTLWVPLTEGPWWCVAQVRPLTTPTGRPEDIVGTELDGVEAEPLALAHREGRPVTEGEPDWSGAAPRAPRGHPGAARGRGGGRAREGHQPLRDAVAIGPRAHLPRHRRRPLPHGLGGHLPARGSRRTPS